jgi:hypothetical protein
MTIWQDENGGLHDDMGGAALSLPSWPAGLVQLTDAEVVALRAPTLAQVQASQIATLAAAYQAASQQSVTFTTKAGVTKTFQADASSQAIIQQSLAGYSGSQSVPTGFYWVSADNTLVPFVFSDLQGLAAAMIAQGWAAFQQLQTLKTQVISATTVAVVQAVVWP